MSVQAVAHPSAARSYRADAVAARERPAAAVPPPVDLDASLRRQRLWLVRVYSAGIALFGLGWCVAFFGGVGQSAGDSPLVLVTTAHAAVLGTAGCYALLRCWTGDLRHAAYANLGALILAGTINLAVIANAEGAGVATYAVAASVAALALEGREWAWFGLALAVSALAGALLHAFPLAEQVTLPRSLAVGSLLVASTLGVAVPAVLFWVFSRDLTSSRAEAWALAHEAGEARQRATQDARALEQRTEQLQAKNGELSDFLYVVSHDLRAPLINLEGFGQTLQQGIGELGAVLDAAGTPPERWPALREEIDESLDFILRSVTKMDFLVRGLVELSRLDSRPVGMQPVDLARVVDDVVASLHHTISTRGIAVRVQPLPFVTGDPLRLSQVFGNLLDNAVKYMPSEGEARIDVGLERNGDGARFFVRDTGIGIRPEDQGKIFRLFARLGAPTVPGDGLGLTAVKKIIEQHGGSIWVESALGAGSTFWFTLPGRDATDRGGPDATTSH
jgi:signal transduction histidine kinase